MGFLIIICACLIFAFVDAFIIRRYGWTYLNKKFNDFEEVS